MLPAGMLLFLYPCLEPITVAGVQEPWRCQKCSTEGQWAWWDGVMVGLSGLSNLTDSMLPYLLV